MVGQSNHCPFPEDLGNRTFNGFTRLFTDNTKYFIKLTATSVTFPPAGQLFGNLIEQLHPPRGIGGNNGITYRFQNNTMALDISPKLRFGSKKMFEIQLALALPQQDADRTKGKNQCHDQAADHDRAEAPFSKNFHRVFFNHDKPGRLRYRIDRCCDVRASIVSPLEHPLVT